MASYALVAARYQLLSSPYLFICLLFANPKSKLDFRSVILNPLKISYLFILLNFCWDWTVRINFGLSISLSPKGLELLLSESLSSTFGFGLSNSLSPYWNIEVTFWMSDRSDRSFRSAIRSAKGWSNLWPRPMSHQNQWKLSTSLIFSSSGNRFLKESHCSLHASSLMSIPHYQYGM